MLWQRLVQERGYSGAVSGGVNLLGNEFTYDGPMLWMLYLVHDPAVAPEAIVADVDAEIARLQAAPPTAAELARALTKIRAALYDLAGSSTRFGLLDLLACFALFDNDPARINRIESEFRAVTPERISRRGAPLSDARDAHDPDRRTRPCHSRGRAMNRLAALLLPLLLAAPSGQAREEPPAPGHPRDFRLPGKETLRLQNGLSMTFIDYGSVPKVTAIAVVRTGNIDEGESTWLADVAVEMLKEGTQTRNATDIAQEAAGMGGTLNVGAGAEQTTLGISVLSEHAVAAVKLLADVLRNPRFPESELPRVIANFERTLAVARSDPQGLADEALARLVYGDHPFGRTLPRDGQLAGYDIADVRGFHTRNFGAARTHVYVAGRYDRATLEVALKDAFGDWATGPPATELPPHPSETLQLALIDSPGAPQSSVRIAVPVPHPAAANYFQTTVMNSLLGGTFSSRITTNIREDKGYSYSPNSSISARRGSALWVLQAEVTSEHTAAAITEIFNEIDRLQREAPSTAELQAIKAFRSGLFVISNSSPSGVLGQFAFMDLHGLPDDFLTNWVASVHAVTPAQVSAITGEYIRRDRMTVVVAGDLATIGDSVRQLPQLKGARMP